MSRAGESTRFVTMHFAPASQRPPSPPTVSRFLAVVIALICGAWIFGYGSDSEAQYWLHKDTQQGKAEVTRELWTSHNSVAYRFTVDGKEYTGASGRSYRDPRYARVGAGEHSPVWYSASHPWFSTLREPEPQSWSFSSSSKPAPSSPSSLPLTDGPSTSIAEASFAPAAAPRGKSGTDRTSTNSWNHNGNVPSLPQTVPTFT